MKKMLTLGIIIIFIMGCAVLSYAGEGPSQTSSLNESRKQIGNKAERGLENILFGWTEIPRRVVSITRESKNPFWGLFAGTYQGACKGFARTASGVVDVATCGIKSSEKAFVEPDMKVE